MLLKRLNWNQRNYEALNDFLAGVRPGDIAVFDWDNTCICGDIGDAIFRFQALHLQFKFNHGDATECAFENFFLLLYHS
jgi:hypothetical protein